ncbi:MAG: hypothetical protein LQ340_007525 [Diploschistes diacapsis]|nr:MAG: hypothetical protein LQ340_007525 [Diploschistes diacapsis]
MDMFDPSMMMNSMRSNFSAQKSQFIQGCTGFAAGATVAVALRLFARWKNSTKLAADDLSITLSLLPLWALAGTGVGMAMKGGLAQQEDALTPAQASVFYPAAFASYILYALSITAAKLSILLLYRRIFTSRPFRNALYAFMAICILWGIIVILLVLLRCHPVAAAWAPNGFYAGATCINLQPLYYGTASSNFLLDVIINLLPARQIWGLQLPKKQRILLILCMCLGVISIAAGVGRLLTIPSLVATNLPATIAMPYLFTIIEPAFAIICACLPTYRPLALWLGHRIKSSRAGSRMRSFMSTSSMHNASRQQQRRPSGSRRRSRASGFFARWEPVTASVNEKEALTSTTNMSPDLGRGGDAGEL